MTSRRQLLDRLSALEDKAPAPMVIDHDAERQEGLRFLKHLGDNIALRLYHAFLDAYAQHLSLGAPEVRLAWGRVYDRIHVLEQSPSTQQGESQ